MKTQQVVALLLCALLSSTLAHDYLQAKAIHHPQHQNKLANHEHQHQRHHPKLKHHSRHHQTHARSHSTHLNTRDVISSRTCHVECTGQPIGGGITLHVNGSLHLVGLVNGTAGVAIIFDIDAQLVGLFNGNNGSAIILNITSETGVYIAGGSNSSITWLTAHETFQVFFESLTTLSVFLSAEGAVQFDASTTQAIIWIEALAILIHLDSTITYTVIKSVATLISFIVRAYGGLFVLIGGVLSGILELIGNVAISIYGDVVWFINVLVGIGKLIGNIEGGLQYLIGLGLTIDFAILLGLADGFAILVELLLSISRVVDLSVLGDIITDAFRILEILAYLGGYLYGGITGAIRAIISIITHIRGEISFDALVQVLLHVSISASGSIDVQAGIQVVLDFVSQQSNSSSELQLFADIFVQLQNGTLEIDGINILNLIEDVLDNVGQGITLVVTVLVAIEHAISLATSLPNLLLSLLELLRNETTNGIHLLEAVFEGISSVVEGGINIIEYIIKHTNIGKILADFPNLGKILEDIPVVNIIFKALVTAVANVTNGAENLASLLTGSGGIVGQIFAWLKVVFKINIKI